MREPVLTNRSPFKPATRASRFSVVSARSFWPCVGAQIHHLSGGRKTVGGGVGIAAAADYALATSFSSVKLSELAIGIGPFVVGPAVERKMGTAAFTALAIDAATCTTPNGRKNKDSMHRYSMTLRPWTKPLMRWRNDWQLSTRKPWRN